VRRLGALRLVLAGAACALAPAAFAATPAPAPAAASATESAEAPSPGYREAFVAFKSKDYARALGALDKVLLADPKNARALVLKGRALAAQGKLPLALDTIKQGLLLQPTLAAGHRALGDLYFQQRDYAAARLSYLQAQRSGDADKDTALLVLYCDIGLQQLGEAERIFVTFNSFDAKAPAYYFAKAALAQVAGRSAETAQALQDAILIYGDQVFAQYARDYFFLFASKP
jgi:tetratricopeptide (TPR) repeat protein